jgi:hypothetical protein
MEGRGIACRVAMVVVRRGAVPVRVVVKGVRDRSQKQDQRYGDSQGFHHSPASSGSLSRTET